MRIVGSSRRTFAIVMVAALVAGLSTWAAVTASAGAREETCWIDVSSDVLIPDAPPGAADPDGAIEQRRVELDADFKSSKPIKAPGGRPFLESRLDKVKKAKLDKKDKNLAHYNVKDATGKVSADIQVERSQIDGTWRVIDESVALPAGTDCSADQLSD